jgi:putative aldouronate transport system permease protein
MQTSGGLSATRSSGLNWNHMLKSVRRRWQLYLIVLLPVVYVLIFKYVPMYGAQIAFREFTVLGNGDWVGFKYFRQFWNSPLFGRLVGNTLGISFYSLLAGMPIPIILALALNEIGSKRYRKAVQFVTYAPHFISTVVLVSMVMQFLSAHNGLISSVNKALGNPAVNYMGVPALFRHIYVWSGIWQNAGYASIIYIAALSGIAPELYEAAVVDGANRLKRIWHVDLPGILPTVTILLIMNMGQLMNVGFEKVFLMQNPINMQVSEVIATHVYKTGLIGLNYSFSTAVGLFNSVINLAMLTTVNFFAARLGETSLW